VTQLDPIRSLSVVKQILDNGLTAVSVTCEETQTVYGISRLSGICAFIADGMKL